MRSDLEGQLSAHIRISLSPLLQHPRTLTPMLMEASTSWPSSTLLGADTGESQCSCSNPCSSVDSDRARSCFQQAPDSRVQEARGLGCCRPQARRARCDRKGRRRRPQVTWREVCRHGLPHHQVASKAGCLDLSALQPFTLEPSLRGKAPSKDNAEDYSGARTAEGFLTYIKEKIAADASFARVEALDALTSKVWDPARPQTNP